jgi:penicillin-binding protein 1B
VLATGTASRARTKQAWLIKALVISGIAAGLLLEVGVVAAAVFCVRVSRSLKARLADGGPCGSTTLYSLPATIATGDDFSTGEIATELRAAGYASGAGKHNSYQLSQDAITIHKAPEGSTRIRVNAGKITEIADLPHHQTLPQFKLPPQVLAQVHCGVLEDRRPLHFEEIPPNVVHALLSAEDKHFFVHAGFDPFRLVKSLWVNLKSHRPDQGGSTLTMQLARSLYLDPEKTWGRKIQELLIAEVLEFRLSKKQILEEYANRIYFGRRAGVNITGFEAASQYYFGHRLSELTVGQAATLAGIVQRPSYFDPIRHPDRAAARRNVVLALMQRNGYLSDADRGAAARTPISTMSSRENNNLTAPWFVSLALNQLGKSAGARADSSLDPLLQRAAIEAVTAGLQEVDKRAALTGPGKPEVALVALDPLSGEVRALVGGRDFSKNEVNHAIAQRQPGSVFKPFVYAAALQSSRGKFTPATLLEDEPTTFKFGVQEYTPGNFGESYGELTLRHALAYSDNIATVSLAEQVGYDKVASLALAAGFNDRIRATPALALGAYESTPLEIAGAYSLFANGGTVAKPTLIVRGATSPGPAILNPAVAFLMQDLLAEVIRSGTAAGVHSRGFNLPSAGKTGTTRDGWFAGYVSNLICVVWVGYDDNTDLKLEGAKSALPIWTEFMRRAAKRAEYRQPLAKIAPGITTARIDSDTGLLAGPYCTKVRMEYFVRGTEPREICDLERRESGGASRVGTPAANPRETSASSSPLL